MPAVSPTATRHVEFETTTQAGAQPAHLHATVALTTARIRVSLDSGWVVPRSLKWRDSLFVRVNLSQGSKISGGSFETAMLAPWDRRVDSLLLARGDSLRLTRPVAFDFPWPCDRDLTQLWPTLQLRWGRAWNYAQAPKELLAELSRELQLSATTSGMSCQP